MIFPCFLRIMKVEYDYNMNTKKQGNGEELYYDCTC